MRAFFQVLRKIGKLLVTPILIVVTFVYAMFQGGFVSWFLFYSFLPFGLYSLLLSFYRFQITDVQRVTNQKEYAAGEKFRSTIILERKYPFPLLYLIVEDILPAQLKKHGQAKVILFPGWKRHISYEYEFDSLPRGEHCFSKIRVKTGDIFGFVEKERTFSTPDTFLVYPQYVDIAYRQLETRFEQGTTSSNLHLERDATVSVGVREYKPGDRFSWIDWKTSARRNHLMTKEFEQQQSHDVVMFMDRTESPLFEQVVSFTASLARAILRKGSQVALISIGKERTFFPLQSGDSQQQCIFYHLARVQADSTLPFSQTITAELPKIQQPATFIIVTSKLSSDIERIVGRATIQNRNFLIFIVKEKPTQLSSEESHILASLRKRQVFVKAVYEGHYTDAFLR